jgi:hypothetical protein
VREAIDQIVDTSGFPESEWVGIAERIWSTDEATQRSHDGGERGALPSLANVALNLLTAGYGIYRSADDAELVAAAKGTTVVNSLGSSGLRQAVAAGVYESTGKVPNGSVVTDALNAFAGSNMAAPSRRVWIRAGETEDGRLVLDLADDDLGVAVVGAGGWEITDTSPVLFRRPAGALCLPSPSASGDVWAARQLFNCSDDDYRLLVAWQTAALFPSIAHPVLCVVGEPGTAKTWTTRRAVQTVDPHVAQDMAFPAQGSWVQALRTSWAVAFDNVSRIEPWQSDAMCRAVTGDGYRAWRLYTDGEAVEYQLRRVLALNGLGLAGMRGDLTDRSVHMEQARIEPQARLEEADLETRWRAAWPVVLGGLLNLAADVLRLQPDIHPVGLSRLADFSRVLAAIDEATGWNTVEKFTDSRKQMAHAVLDSDPLAVALDGLLGGRPSAEWTPTEMLECLTGSVPDRQMPSPQTLPSRLRLIAPMTEQLWGLRVDQGRTGRKRYIKLTRLSTLSGGANHDSPDGSGSSDPTPKEGTRGFPPGPSFASDASESRQDRHGGGLKLPPDVAAEISGRGGRSCE